ncbi:hypothetical protein MSPP1_001137 [Malassezia sp. CBS 17886]|nr:hypothetical protein MSPP1_001137 [Malassezia sp. CBS 17886]
MAQLNTLASEAQVTHRPSYADGVLPDVEEDLRIYGCRQIQQAGQLLRLPQVAMGTAQVLFQRFWYISSMAQFSVVDIGMGALLLGSKLEEAPLRLRDLINVYDYLDQRARHEAQPDATDHTPAPHSSFRYQPSEYFSEYFYDRKDAMAVAEMQILKRLGFDVHVHLPHALMINYLQVLGLSDVALESGARGPSHAADAAGLDTVSAAQAAWNFLNDALQTPVYCLFAPHVIACASIYLLTLTPRAGSRSMYKPMALPVSPQPWWSLFDVTHAELRACASHMIRLYDTQMEARTATRLRLAELCTKRGLRAWLEQHR